MEVLLTDGNITHLTMLSVPPSLPFLPPRLYAWAFADELGKTRSANARLSTIKHDLERENEGYRIKSPALTSYSPRDARRSADGERGHPHGNLARVTASPHAGWHEEDGGATGVRGEWGRGDGRLQQQLHAASRKIKQQDEEIKELQGYCTALQRSPSKSRVSGAVGMLGIA